MSRRRHPDRTIEQALAYAESQGWRVEGLEPRAHGWGKMYCPSENHARQIKRVVDGCLRRAIETDDEHED